MTSQKSGGVLWATAAAVVLAVIAGVAAGPWACGAWTEGPIGAGGPGGPAGQALADSPPAEPPQAAPAPAAKAGDAETVKTEKKTRTPDVVYVPTPQPVVDAMLKLADVKKSDVVYDLGCGDGRIVVTAAQRYGCKAKGFDIDPQRVNESAENVKKNKVEDLVTIENKDIFQLDLSEASVVTLYLLPSLNVRLIPQLEKLKPGSRIVSHNFDMDGVKPAKVIKVQSEGDIPRTVYLWITPLEKEE